jgi:hypothetical protein
MRSLMSVILRKHGCQKISLANSGSFWQHCNEQYIREYLSYIKEHTEFLLQETSSNRDYISMEEDPNPFLLVSRFQVQILFRLH